jgi:hypothetical protein
MKITITTQHILIVIGILFLAMIACVPIALIAAYPPRSSDLPATQAAATVQAILTQNAAAQPSPTATQTPLPPTALPPTSIPATNTPLPTFTPITYCDWVEFVKDVSFPDGTVLVPGETFTKIWRLKNRGTCAWTPEYKLVFTSGAQLSGPTVVSLPGYVAPGQTVDVSVTLTAPDTNGHYTGYWMLRNPTGSLFGAGPQANTAFYVDIKTREILPHGTVTGNFYYPSEFNPPLILYFENVGTGEIIQFSIPENNMSFSVLLPNGRYYAYAWAPNYNLEGAYINPDLTMKTLVVKGGQITSGINISDWSVYPHGRGQ